MSTKHTPTVKDLVEHLQIADAHMRKLSGVLWHQNMMQEHAEIANEIKRGENLLKQLKGTQGNLIDAAPEMLQACKLAESHHLPTPVLIALRNAIIKANGGVE